MPDIEPTYQELEQQLHETLARLESGELDIDAAVEQYDQALQLIKQLEQRLTAAENRVIELAGQ